MEAAMNVGTNRQILRLAKQVTRLFILLVALGLPSVCRCDPLQKGMNAGDLLFMPTWELRSRFAEFRDAGVKWLRVEFDWNRIQPDNEDTYIIQQHDRIVALAREFHISILGLIYFCPAWANGGQKPPAYPPADPGAFGRFAGYLAARYASSGVRHWEIWNEPNLGSSWKPVPSPSQYVALLKAAYEAIKNVDSGATVISGGLAQPNNTGTTMRAAEFLDALYRNGARPFFDAVGNHPYTSPSPPDRANGNSWQQMESSDGLRGIMTKYHDHDKLIWVTEYGAPTDGEANTVISETAQVQLLKSAFELASRKPDLGPVFWYNFRDWCPKGKPDPDCYYGLLRFDNSRKPSYAAFIDLH
jgi:hypothetical protein